MTDGERTTFGLAAIGDAPTPLAFDSERYIDFLDGLDMTESQKIEFLKSLWFIAETFVRWGWGVDSILPLLAQNASESCGNAVEEPIPTHEFNVAADDGATGKDQ